MLTSLLYMLFAFIFYCIGRKVGYDRGWCEGFEACKKTTMSTLDDWKYDWRSKR